MEYLFSETNVAWDSDQACGHYMFKKHHSCFEPMKDCLFIDYIIKWVGGKYNVIGIRILW